MKLRHYVLIILTLLTIAFAQPLVLFLGGVTLIGSVIAFIFSDLPSEKQDAWERKLNELLQRALSHLRRRPQKPRKARAGKDKSPVEPSSLVEEGRPDALIGQLEEKPDWVVTEIVKSPESARRYDTEQR